jgi:hypothetical protein
MPFIYFGLRDKGKSGFILCYDIRGRRVLGKP